jgi:hypothetical protein
METVDGVDAKVTCAGSTRRPGVTFLLMYVSCIRTNTHVYCTVTLLTTSIKTNGVLTRIQK